VNKLGIVVPYRDREEQLSRFKKHLTAFLKRTLTVPFTIIVVEQSDRKEFNRGKLLNIGFEEAKKQKCTYVIFHDVDMIPIKGDYTYSDNLFRLLISLHQMVSLLELYKEIILVALPCLL